MAKCYIPVFADLKVGDKFRWVGGQSVWVKVDDHTCHPTHKPNLQCNPSWWEEVVSEEGEKK